MAVTKCDHNCLWMPKCVEKRNCACQCESWFRGSNMSIMKACIAKCNVDPNHVNAQSKEDFMCSEIGAQEMFNRHGHLCKGFDPLSGTAQGVAFEKNAAASGANSRSQGFILFAGGILVVILLVAFYM